MTRNPKTSVRAAQRWTRYGRTCRVLTVIEGYVVFRFPRAMPGVCHWRDFERQFKRNEETHQP